MLQTIRGSPVQKECAFVLLAWPIGEIVQSQVSDEILSLANLYLPTGHVRIDHEGWTLNQQRCACTHHQYKSRSTGQAVG